MRNKIHLVSSSGDAKVEATLKIEQDKIHIDIGSQRIEIGISNIGHIYLLGLGVYGHHKEIKTGFSFNNPDSTCLHCKGVGYTINNKIKYRCSCCSTI